MAGAFATDAQVQAGLAADRSIHVSDTARIAAIWLAMFRAGEVRSISIPDSLPALGSYRRNPAFWSDLEVRCLAIETHRQMTLEHARAHIALRVGWNRTPKRSALARCWKRLDLLAAKEAR